MITYKVSYKQKGDLFYKTLRNVKGDGIMPEHNSSRFFITEDETRYEIPVKNTIFKFSKERWTAILDRMNKDAGQNVQIDKR